MTGPKDENDYCQFSFWFNEFVHDLIVWKWNERPMHNGCGRFLEWDVNSFSQFTWTDSAIGICRMKRLKCRICRYLCETTIRSQPRLIDYYPLSSNVFQQKRLNSSDVRPTMPKNVYSCHIFFFVEKVCWALRQCESRFFGLFTFFFHSFFISQFAISTFR